MLKVLVVLSMFYSLGVLANGKKRPDEPNYFCDENTKDVRGILNGDLIPVLQKIEDLTPQLNGCNVKLMANKRVSVFHDTHVDPNKEPNFNHFVETLILFEKVIDYEVETLVSGIKKYKFKNVGFSRRSNIIQGKPYCVTKEVDLVVDSKTPKLLGVKFSETRVDAKIKGQDTSKNQDPPYVLGAWTCGNTENL